jgi:hypothetical protein
MALPLGSGGSAARTRRASLDPRNLIGDVAVAARYVLQDGRRLRVFGLFGALTACYSLWEVLTAYLSIEVGARQAQSAIQLAAQVGEVVVAVSASVIGLRSTPLLAMAATVLLALGAVASGLAGMNHLAFGTTGTVALIVVFRLVSGMAASIGGGGAYNLIVYGAPASLTARVTALVESIGLGAVFGVARFGVGTLNDATNPSTTFIVVGFFAAAIALTIAVAEFQAQRWETAVMRLRVRVFHALSAGGTEVAAFRYFLLQKTR